MTFQHRILWHHRPGGGLSFGVRYFYACPCYEVGEANPSTTVRNLHLGFGPFTWAITLITTRP